MVKPFEDTAFSLKKNEVGPVVETDFGYHVIQVIDHSPAKTQPLDKNLKAKITNYLEQQKQTHPELAGFVTELETLTRRIDEAVAKRIGEIGTMRALGFRRRSILAALWQMFDSSFGTSGDDEVTWMSEA